MAILVSLYVPNGPKVVITASTVAASTAAFNSILLTYYFSNCCNCGSDYIIRHSM